MLNTISKIIIFSFNLLVFTILCLIFIIPYIIVTSYKSIIVFVANKLLGRNLIPFDGVKMSNFQLLKSDLKKIKLTKSKHNNNQNVRLLDDFGEEYNQGLTNVIGALITYNGKSVALEDFQNLFYTKFLNVQNIKPQTKYLNLYVKVVKFGGYLFKEKVKSIDLKNQIYSVNLPDSIPLEEFCADWFTRPFNPNSNGLLWEIAFINSNNKLNTQKKSHLTFKIHHCLADGYTCKHMLDVIFEKDTKILKEVRKSSVLENIYTTISTPIALLKFTSKLSIVQKNSSIKLEHNNYKSRISYGTIELNKFKEIKANTKAHILCILHSLFAGAVRELHLSNGLEIPESTAIAGPLTLPGHPFKERMTNWASGYVLDIKINETNPLKRVLEIEEQFKQFFAKGLPKMFVGVLGDLIDICPYMFFNWLPNISATAGFTPLLFEDDYELLGQKITNMHIMGELIQGLALVGTSVSHGGQLDYTIIANKQLISQEHLDRITKKFIPEELDKIYTNALLSEESNV